MKTLRTLSRSQPSVGLKFSIRKRFQVIVDSIEYLRKEKGLQNQGYVIMPNHIHVLWQSSSGVKLSSIVSSFKRHTYRKLYKAFINENEKYMKYLLSKNKYKKKRNKHRFQLWQSYNYPVVIE